MIMILQLCHNPVSAISVSPIFYKSGELVTVTGNVTLFSYYHPHSGLTFMRPSWVFGEHMA